VKNRHAEASSTGPRTEVTDDSELNGGKKRGKEKTKEEKWDGLSLKPSRGEKDTGPEKRESLVRWVHGGRGGWDGPGGVHASTLCLEKKAIRQA